MSTSLIIIYATLALDAIGLGLIFPILPRLLEQVSLQADVAPYLGSMTALYAVMQFVFAPVLGALSDRIGRRPVLLLSLAGASLNYLLMACAPQLWMLFLGRAIAGLSSANMSVATAYISDISSAEQRAGRFGMCNAMFGAGFIIGPVLGGLLGDQWVRLPFIAAAVLNGANLLLALCALPESRPRSGQPLQLQQFNPLLPLRWVLAQPQLLPITLVFFAFSAAGEAYGTCWALWGQDAFHWNGLRIGLSLGAFGVCQTLAQALLPGRATRLLGERRAILAGLLGGCCALSVMALARQDWLVFIVMPLFALAGIGAPALQALASRLVTPEQQGEFQGVLAAAVSLASIIAPLGFSAIYMAVRAHWPGAIWLAVLAVNLLIMPLVLRLRFGAPAA